ncbi:NAD-dependent epimerase/dehydratase family protein [Halarcobacter sp.]|uniref:NAD-dependent epimerase/dehydratase family protein n=1 Tax=Halarcobacter sp. TaxID=2321133 RepID=UPI002AA60BCD|nr:NAD-dependent epimerase/dehydratase family protein [Halarcobacter sp.]
MNILITGCAGFIGSHLAEELLKDKKNTIIGIDNLSSGNKENLELINSFDEYNNFLFIKADIRDFYELTKIIKNHNIQYIYHLAAIASVQISIRNPLLSNEVNVKGTLNVLEASKQNGVKRIVFSSSAAVYGDENSVLKSEKTPTKPISSYGYEKLISEYHMKLYNDQYNLETVILRYFNVFGERQNTNSNYSGVITIFNDKFKNNEIPNIYGDGEQYRDFIYVKDIVKITIKAMNIQNISGELFCVGSSKKTTINELFNLMNKKYNKNFKANYLKTKNGDIKKSICDNSKLMSTFNIKLSKIDNFI